MLKRMIGLMVCILLIASAASARVIEKYNMPEELNLGGATLALNGGGVRSDFLLKVYVCGLYLQQKMTDPAAIIDANAPMDIRMYILSGFFATSARVRDALYKGFRGTMPRGDIKPIEDKVKEFNSFFADKIHTGDIFDVLYVPGKGTSVYKNGELKGTIPGYDFKKNVWGIWLGSRPAQESLKKEMASGDMRVSVASAQRTIVTPEEMASKAKSEAASQKAAAEETTMAKAETAQKSAEMEAQSKAAEAQAKATEEAAKAKEMKAAAEAKAKEMKAAEEAKAQEMKAQAEAKKAEAEKEAMMKKEEAKAEAEKMAAEKAQAATAASATAEEATKAAPEMKHEMAPVTDEAFVNNNVYFGYNSAALSKSARKTMAEKVAWLKANPDKDVAIEVSCDPRGNAAYNMALAKRRANSVVKYLTNAGIAESRLEVKILGEENASQDKADYAKERKAHFIIK